MVFVGLGFLLFLGMAVPNSDPGFRLLNDPDRERQAKLQRTGDEVRHLVGEFHARLPRDQAVALGAAYARYSSRFQDSIVDQFRTIFDDALRKRIFIPIEFVFFDLGVRGAKADRPGLNGLRECLAAKAVRVAFFFSTNRLFRKTYRSLQFVEEQVVERGVRAVFVKSGVDTADGKRWRGLLNMHAMMDEFVVGMSADHIRAAHEGLLEKRLVFGTISFGYAGRPLDGPNTRRGKPRMSLAVDPVAGPWVGRIFRWYSVDRTAIDEIVRRLNTDPTVPLPPKSTNRTWTHDAVRKLLSNTRYRGCWRYGVTETVWLSSKDYARQIARKEPLKEVLIEDLRLISDDQWFAAQVMLAKEAGRAAGRKPRDGDTMSRPRVLNGLFVCQAHNRKLYVGGVHGKYMTCKDCRGLPIDQRPLYSQLPRTVALRKTCARLADLLRADSELVCRVVAACRRYASEIQAPDPTRTGAIEARLAKREQRIKFILRNPGETDADQAESEVELRRLRKERTEDQTELDALRAAASRVVTVPAESDVLQLIDELADVLVAAANESDAAGSGQVRAVIDLLTGGRIDLVQAGEPKRRRGWLRGRFHCRLLETVSAKAVGVEISDDSGEREIEIDFRNVPESVPTSVVAEVATLYESGVLVKEIARRLEMNRNAVAGIIDDWHAERGLERQDGRSRRSKLAAKHLEPPSYQLLSEKVVERANHGALFGEIASEMGVHIATVRAAWVHWHVSRGLTAPDGRTRRKGLIRKSSTKGSAGG
ncbi:MAG: Recombinase [Gemmataceae bacterium]|nr:Recombinase [Gemmataceae bacterium]